MILNIQQLLKKTLVFFINTQSWPLKLICFSVFIHLSMVPYRDIRWRKVAFFISLLHCVWDVFDLSLVTNSCDYLWKPLKHISL